MNSIYKFFLIVFLIGLHFFYQNKAIAQRISKATGNWNNAAGTWTGTVAAAGTITVALNGTAVTGVGTTFTTQVTVGSPIFNGAGNYIGIIASITNNTNLVLIEGAMVAVTGAAYLRTDPTNANASVPNAATTDVVIRAGHTVTQNQDAATRVLAVRGSYTTDNTNRNLTVNNNFTILSGGAFNSFRATLVVTGTATVSGTFSDTNNNGANTFSSTLTINAGGSLDAGNSNLTVTGATTNAGTFQDTNNNGVTQLTGLVTNTGTWTTTAVTTTTNLDFRGGITNNGTFNAGAAIFSTNTQAVGGTNALSFANDVNFPTNTTTTTLNQAVTIGGNLSIATGATLQLTTQNFTVTGTTGVTGTLNDNNNAGTNLFTGLVTINGGGTWNTTAVTTTGNLSFRNGITSNGTAFSAGAATFNTNNQALNGATAISFANNVDITGAINITNNQTATIAGNLNGSVAGSTWTNANNSTLNYGGANSPMATGTFTTNTCTNTVNYNGAGNQNVSGVTYCNLATATGGTKTLLANTTVGGTLNIGVGSTLELSTFNISVTGATTVSGTLNDNSNAGVNTFLSLVTVNNTGAWATTAVTTATNLDFRNGITNNSANFNTNSAVFSTNSQTLGGTGTINFTNTFTLANSITLTSNTTTVNIAGNLSIPTAHTLALGTSAFTVTGTTTIDGTLNFTSATGTKTFTGSVTSVNPATWNDTGNPNINFGADFNINSPNFTAGTGIYSLTNTTLGTLTSTFVGTSGTPFIPTIPNLTVANNAIYNVSFPVRLNVNNLIVNAGGDLRNVTRIDVATSISGTGTINQQLNAVLRVGGTITNVTLGATANANVVEYYANANQTVLPTNYYSLYLTSTAGNTTNTKTLTTTAAIRILGVLNITQATFAFDGTSGGTLTPASVSKGAFGRYTYIPTVTTVPAFNTATIYNGQFDEIQAVSSANGYMNNNYITSQGGNDLTFIRGDGGAGLFAAKTTNFTTAPTVAIIKFSVSARSLFSDNNVATLYIGNGIGANATEDGNVRARIRFNLVAGGSGDQFQVVYPDAGGFTSATQTGSQEIIMVVNTSGSTFNYSNSCGTANTVANNRVDIWVGSTLLVNDQTMANAGQAFQDIKFFYNAGSTNGASPIQPSITLSGLNIQTASPATTSLSGVVNQYAQVTAVDAANRRMTLATGSCFNVGDYVIIMQMKGATIDVTNTATYGNINNYNAAGRYEINQIVGLVAGTTYTFSQSFQFPYDATKNLQVIKMARVVGNATIDGTVTPQAWNGATGGVVAIWATGTLTFNADINVSGMGFRGGARSNDFAGSTIGVDCSEGSFVQNSANWGEKGEGIVMPADATTGTYARGKLANGGGGGNPHNSGGGGGSNFGSGANGGRQWNCIGGDAENGCNVGSQNGNPTATALNNGVGGVNLNYTVDATNTIRLFMGGGGGGGQQNNGLATAGAAGSGIVIIRTGGNIIANNRNIYANGGSMLAAAGNDSGGGGGAGGTIFFDVPSTASFTGTLNVNIRGGKGGDVNFTPGCHGNGGGGGGGVVIFSVPQPPASAVAITRGGGPSSRNQDGSDCANLATAFFCTTESGDGGQVIAGSVVLLPVELLNFTAQKQNTNQVLVAWETASEKNNAYFIVEKSTNGTTFFEVAKVLGRSNSTSLQKYNLTDYNPFVGINYYRLKQVDIDGTVSYSKIVNVLFDELLSLNAELYPNPTNSNSFNINLMNYYGKVAIEVVDITGRRLTTEISQNNLVFQVNLVNPTVAGVYLVKIATENGTITRKIVLQ